jgi:pilus assembly protein Flp/PilA
VLRAPLLVVLEQFLADSGRTLPRAALLFPARGDQSTKVVQRTYSEGGDPMRRRFPLKAQRGQGLVEYALIIALVAIVVIAILVLMGPQIGQIFSTITNGL